MTMFTLILLFFAAIIVLQEPTPIITSPPKMVVQAFLMKSSQPLKRSRWLLTKLFLPPPPPPRTTVRSRLRDRAGTYSNIQPIQRRSMVTTENKSIGENGTDDDDVEEEFVVNWTNANGTISFPARKGETLRTAALRNGKISPHNGRSQLINCRGLGTCGTCAVVVRAGNPLTEEKERRSKVPPPAIQPVQRNRKEQIRLSLPPHGAGLGGGAGEQPLSSTSSSSLSSSSSSSSSELRLACQIQVYGDLNVTKQAGFWGQYDSTLSTHNDCQTYFGDLEFVLDRRRSTQASIRKKEEGKEEK